jgi:hypothetical protein
VVSGDGVVEVCAGAVVLQGPALLYAERAVRLMIRAGRLDGIGPSPLLAELADVLERAAARVTSAHGTPELPPKPVLSLSARDEIPVTEAAEMLCTTTRNVTGRCVRGSLPGRKVAGRWLVERAGVCAAVSRKVG